MLAMSYLKHILHRRRINKKTWNKICTLLHWKPQLSPEVAFFCSKFNDAIYLKKLIESPHWTHSINMRDVYGETLLIAAAKYGAFDSLKYLLSHKHVRVNDTDPYGRYALIFATNYDIEFELLWHKSRFHPRTPYYYSKVYSLRSQGILYAKAKSLLYKTKHKITSL